jgi:hypothetical protein
MIRPENNAKGRNLHAPDREEHMRIYLFGQPCMSISSPSSTSDFAITLSIVPLLNSLASVKTFSLFSRNRRICSTKLPSSLWSRVKANKPMKESARVLLSLLRSGPSQRASRVIVAPVKKESR